MTNTEGITRLEDQTSVYDDWSWNDSEASVVCEETDGKRVYDLEERTARFGEAIIDFAKTIPQGPLTSGIICQLVGAGTSIGANYVEATMPYRRKSF
jgi:hypothetical protein